MFIYDPRIPLISKYKWKIQINYLLDYLNIRDSRDMKSTE